MGEEKILDISWKTIVKISIAVALFYLLFAIKDIAIWFIFAITISLLFDPPVAFLQKLRVPRSIAVAVLYLFAFGFLSLAILLVIPIFITEIRSFLNNFPQYFEQVSPILQGLGFEAFSNLESFLNGLGGTLENMAGNIFGVFFSIFGGLFTTLFVVITAIFLSLEERGTERFLVLLFPKKYEVQVTSIWERCRKKVSGWFGARILASIFVGVVSYIAMIIFNINYPFTLALFAGVLNFIPYAGPMLTAVIFFILIFPTDQFKAILILIAFTAIQQIESSILSPILMKKFAGIPPVLVLLSLVIGGTLWGILGALLAMPLFGILFEFFKEFLQKRRDKDTTVVV